jgi:hypothetical protein
MNQAEIQKVLSAERRGTRRRLGIRPRAAAREHPPRPHSRRQRCATPAGHPLAASARVWPGAGPPSPGMNASITPSST